MKYGLGSLLRAQVTCATQVLVTSPFVLKDNLGICPLIYRLIQNVNVKIALHITSATDILFCCVHFTC